MNKASIIARVCDALSQRSQARAATIAAAEYPFVPLAKAERRYIRVTAGYASGSTCARTVRTQSLQMNRRSTVA